VDQTGRVGSSGSSGSRLEPVRKPFFVLERILAESLP
jgi:hypothetical protein